MPPYPNAEQLPEDFYDCRVVFEPESPDEERSEQGAVLYGWPEDLRMPMWASVQAGTVNQAEADGRLTQKSVVVVHSPNNPGAQAGDRFQWGERTLVVEGPTSSDGGQDKNFITECVEVT